MIITKLNNKFVETRIDDEVVLMNIDTGNFYALKKSSLAIWDMIATTNTKASIITELTAQFSVSHDQCEADVDSFLTEVEKAGFVTLA